MANGRTASVRGAQEALPSFALVAGLGWIADMLILFCLVRLADAPPGWANVASSLFAAALVYLVAHRRVHAGRPDAISLRLGAYLLYTILLVLAASSLLQLLVHGFAPWAAPAQAVIAAKVLITPPQFLLNFFMSRYLATRRGRVLS